MGIMDLLAMEPYAKLFAEIVSLLPEAWPIAQRVDAAKTLFEFGMRE